MGEGEIIQKLWESHSAGQRESAVLARIHQGEMQAEICEDHSVPHSYEEAEAEAPEETCSIAEEDWEAGET